MEKNSLEVASLLHDIGKPRSFLENRIKDHAKIAAEILESTGVSTEIIEPVRRHHHAAGYEGPRPIGDGGEIDWIVCISNNIVLGSDEPPPDIREIAWPLILKNIVNPEILITKFDRRTFGEKVKSFEARIKPFLSQESPYPNPKKVADFVSSSILSKIPVDVTHPDHSIAIHSRLARGISLTVAEGGYKGKSSGDYEISLLLGDINGIQKFIQESMRLRDLKNASEIVDEALDAAVKPLENELSEDNIIFKGGGNFLVLVPPETSEELKRKCKENFEDHVRTPSLGITLHVRRFDGIEESGPIIEKLTSTRYPKLIEGWRREEKFTGHFLKFFGPAWDLSRQELREAKRKKLTEAGIYSPVDQGEVTCDICGRRPATREERRILPIDASPRKEKLCESCYWKRERSYSGVDLEDIAERSDTNTVGILLADGDDVGEFIYEPTGEEVPSLPRQCAVSHTLDEAVKSLEKVVKEFEGETIYAGGDDLLTILPGSKSFRAALKIEKEYEKRTFEQLNTSAGLYVFQIKYPLYIALEKVRKLKEKAKDKGKNRIAFQMLRGSRERIKSPVFTWSDFEKALKSAEEIIGGEIAGTELHRIGRALVRGGEKEVLAELAYKIGKTQDPNEWKKLLSLRDDIKEGRLDTVLEIAKTLEGGE